MNPILAVLSQGGVEQIRQHEQGAITGELPVQRVGLAKCMAAVEGGRVQMQLQFMPVSLSDVAADAVRRCLEIVQAQVKAPGFSSGLDMGRGVVWIGAAGDLNQTAPTIRTALAIAPDLFRKLNALCASEALAETYLAMQARAVSGQAVPSRTH